MTNEAQFTAQSDQLYASVRDAAREGIDATIKNLEAGVTPEDLFGAEYSRLINVAFSEDSETMILRLAATVVYLAIEVGKYRIRE